MTPGRRSDLFAAGALAAAAVAAYLPVWRAGFIWDDQGHVTRPELRSLRGLGRIWIEPGATQQYYPLLHSAFWAEHRLWGDHPLGYHLLNLAWHVCAALLFAAVLRRLAAPGAWIAAFLFALHPVAAESVAWISEQKNTLSAVLYFASALAYLRFDERRRKRDYAAASALFLGALLSKTVTASLPGALLVALWWKRGRLSWRRDAVPLLPWLAAGGAAGAVTAWMERAYIGANGARFDLSPAQHVLLAGRAVCFYLAKLAWPARLAFIYPRWILDASDPRQWLFPAAVAAGLILLVALRRRGPLAAALFFVGTLLPALGFVHVYPFLYSHVADHFQYLACAGPFALAAAGIARAGRACPPPGRAALSLAVLGLAGLLAVRSSREARAFASDEVLWRTTMERNPQCWLAPYNLGTAYAATGRMDDAALLFRRALAVRPDYPEAHNNLGNVLLGEGRTEEAIGHYRAALAADPANADFNYDLGLALARQGRLAEAILAYRRALAAQPRDPDIRDGLARAEAALAAGAP